MIKTAFFSENRTHRYLLTRVWDDTKPMVMWILLNPSTADEMIDDPTIRRTIGYSKDWGYGGVYITNIFAFRATDPKDMKAVKDPIGADNNAYITSYAERSPLVVCGWGVHGNYLDRANKVVDMLKSHNIKLHCLGVTKTGEPKHPLYLPKSAKPVEYRAQT